MKFVVSWLKYFLIREKQEWLKFYKKINGYKRAFDFAVPADHTIKLKECEKKNKYLDFARELKKTMKHEGDNYTNCDGCFWYSKGLLKGLEDLEFEGQVETIQTTAFFRTDRILKRVLETRGGLLSHKLQWKTIS